MLPLQGAAGRGLGFDPWSGELRYHFPCGAAKKKRGLYETFKDNVKRKWSSMNLKSNEAFMKEMALEFLPEGGESRTTWLKAKRGKCARSGRS